MKTELMPLENISAVAIFQEDGLEDLLLKIHAEAESHVPDIETDKGRKAIASIAVKVAKSKTYLDGLGKDLVSVWKNQSKVVDAERRKLRDDLDELKLKIRKPLTDFEDAENERVEKIQSLITEIAEVGTYAETSWIQMSLTEIKQRMEFVNKLYRENNFDEQDDYATEVTNKAKQKIITAMDQRETYDKEQDELAEMREKQAVRDEEDRREKAEKERKDRDDKIAKDAANKASEDTAKEVRRIEAERVVAIKDKQDAVDRAKQAEKQAKIDVGKAAKDERDKIEAEKLAEKEASAAREANTKHRKTINCKAVESLLKTGIDANQARKVVTAIAKNKIPNVKIYY